MFFFFISKKLNREVFTKNLVTFKKWDGFKDEKFWYYEGSLKNSIFRVVHENPVYRGCLKRGLGQFADLIGGGFWGGGDRYPNAHYASKIENCFCKWTHQLEIRLVFFVFSSHQLRSLYQAETETLKLNIIGML